MTNDTYQIRKIARGRAELGVYFGDTLVARGYQHFSDAQDERECLQRDYPHGPMGHIELPIVFGSVFADLYTQYNSQEGK